MEQQSVVFSATILDPLVKPEDGPIPDPIDELKMKKDERLATNYESPPIPPPLTRQCCYVPPIIEHPHERFERHGELADALPSIFLAFGFAYAFGVLTGGLIFSSPSVAIPA